MKKITLILLILLFVININSLQAQEDKYKVIQGIGYLHTQVTMLLVHWEKHPLNHKALDAHEAELQDHIITELEHDEEWVEFMMVEGSLSHFSEHIDEKTKIIINNNLKFYHHVLTNLRNPDDINSKIDEWNKKLKVAENDLYHTIFPALCK
jgi:hypothetical protein